MYFFVHPGIFSHKRFIYRNYVVEYSSFCAHIQCRHENTWRDFPLDGKLSFDWEYQFTGTQLQLIEGISHRLFNIPTTTRMANVQRREFRLNTFILVRTTSNCHQFPSRKLVFKFDEQLVLTIFPSCFHSAWPHTSSSKSPRVPTKCPVQTPCVRLKESSRYRRSPRWRRGAWWKSTIGIGWTGVSWRRWECAPPSNISRN
jgi:hypothetical protein